MQEYVSKHFVYQKIKKGFIPGIKIGTQTAIHAALAFSLALSFIFCHF